MARMEAGAPGLSSGHVHGRVGAGFDPVAGAVTIPRECTGLRWAGQGPEGVGEGVAGGAGHKKEGPLQVAVYVFQWTTAQNCWGRQTTSTWV